MVIAFAVAVFVLPWKRGDHYDPVAPFQCHKGCTMLTGDWPEHYDCTETAFERSKGK